MAKHKSLGQVLSGAARAPRNEVYRSFFGKLIRPTDGDFWASWFGTKNPTGQVVNVNRSLQLSAVWGCVRLISQTISTLPLSLYEREPDGGRKVLSGNPIHRVLREKPNDEMTAVTFWEAVVVSMLLWGNAYIEKMVNGGQTIGLRLLLPEQVAVSRDDRGNLKYMYQPNNGKDPRRIPVDRMMHIPAFTVDGIMGLSPITYGATVFGGAMAADQAAASTFKNGMMPTVAFKVERTLKQEQREEFREYAKTVSGAMNAGRSPVLEQGVSLESIGINPDDAQLLESRGWSVEEICRWFLVPPWMVGHTDKGSNWGSGMEQQMIGFLTFSLSPWLKRIEQAIKKCIIPVEDHERLYAEFSIEGLLRADSAARSAFYSAMTQNGIYTRDDCRVRENLPRRGGNADVLTVQSNLTPIDLLGQALEANPEQAKNSLRNFLGLNDNERPE